MSSFDPNFAPPVPPQALAYSIPAGSSRPGIVTAIGVLCITVACLSALSSFIGGMYSVGFYFVSQMQARMTATSPSYAAMATASAAAAAGPTTAPTLAGGDAGVAVNALDAMLSLDAAHLSELDRLMRGHGREVLGGDDDTPVTAASVRAAVLRSTPQAGPSGKAQFSTAQGTVEIYADRAVFTSADQSTTVQTSARRRQEQVTNYQGSSVSVSSFAGTPGVARRTTLTKAQIEQVVTAAQGTGTTINPAQLQSMRSELAKPNQMLANPVSASPVGSAIAQPNGNLTIYFDTGNVLVLDPAGKIVLSGPIPMPNFAVSGALAGVNAVESLASILLAVYLLIVGILVLRGSFSSPRLLRIYAWIKIPLAIVSGVGLAMLGYALSNAFLNNPGMGNVGAAIDSTRIGFIIAGATAMLFGLAFPVGLLIAVRSKSVKDYFNSVAPSA